jgi:UDP-N-acetylmuramoyl-tripeptide--D-alanyl-D-alanine ligase
MLLGLAALIQAAPLLLILASLLLRPLQLWRNRGYLKGASATLARLNPAIIGITGSFGKTGTKYVLGHILGAHAPVLATPGSVNTPLGIAGVVKDQLQPHHAYFVAEMGAYGPGSIARLCRLAPPAISCITAIGPAHYERFKSLATVAAAKFEIATATHAKGGACVLNVDGIAAEFWQPRVAANPGGYVLVGSNPAHLRPDDFLIENVVETTSGLALTIRHGGVATPLRAPVYGLAQAGNLAVAFAMAVRLGLAKPAIAAAMATAPAAPHRLNVQKQGGQVVIDDSYNANPAGFGAALHTLTLLAEGKRRRVLATPGVVELGTLHAETHARLGNLAAQNADVILAIAPGRMPTFTQAVKVAWGLAAQPPLATAGGPGWQATGGQVLVECATLAAARAWLAANPGSADVILIENDLPERYEARWQL